MSIFAGLEANRPGQRLLVDQFPEENSRVVPIAACGFALYVLGSSQNSEIIVRQGCPTY
jgi:hypothetical protein